jgi:transcriptional regulator with XRE-family HTH domain
MKIANEILWQIYQNKDCTRTEFSKMLGYKTSYSNISQWLNGDKDLTLDQLEKFCKKLNIKLKIEIQND